VVTLLTAPLETGKIYEFNVKGVSSEDGSALSNADAYYTLNKLREKPAKTTKAAVGEWEFFPFCMSHSDSAKRSLDDQAVLFSELGYPGCGHLSQELGYKGFGFPKNTTVAQRAASLEKQGLRLKVAFVRMRLDAAQPIDMEKLKATMPILGKHKSMLGVLLLGDRKKDLDGKAVALLNQIADLANADGVELAIYPHSGDYTETVEQSIRVARKVNRPKQVGVMFNLFHWMNVERNQDLKTLLTEARPWLKMVNINGSSKNKAQVLPLDQGDFEIENLLSILREIDYRGPIGLMCWGIGGDAREHLVSSMVKWKTLASPVRLKLVGKTCEFETEHFKGKIGDGRFIGLNEMIHKSSGTVINGNGRANRHGLLTLYRVFTRNHRYGSAAYGWKEREMLIHGNSVIMHWPATAARPFDLEAKYSFPKPNKIRLQVTVTAKEELTDFEVQTGSYFDKGFPEAGVLMGGGKFVSSPLKLGKWHAFPRDESAKTIIADGRWSHGPSPVKFTLRPNFSSAVSRRRHFSENLQATLESKPTDCFAIYTAHDGEAHFSNYHALFGHTIVKGESATVEVNLTLESYQRGLK
jgi:sugar phosphate isomerase/epimerase